MLVRFDQVAHFIVNARSYLPRNLAPDFTQYLSERPEMSSQDESSRKAKTTRKKNKMKEEKEKKTLQVRDLTPTKDVRGGNRRARGHAFGLNRQEDPRQALRNVNGIFMLPQ